MKVEKTWFYTFARVLLGIVYRCIMPVKVRGIENYPTDQNCILLSNHISAWDPLTVAYTYKHNEIFFFAKDTLFRNKLLAAVLRKLHAFPVKRGETDMKAMRTAMQILKEGHVLGIFPEGHRRNDGTLQPLETGVAVMALKSRVPVVPIIIEGKYRPFQRISVAIGEPILLDTFWEQPVNAEILEAVKQRLMDALQSLKK